jgi:predicted helicase
MHCFQGHHGGRVLPLYRDAGGTSPNIAPGLVVHLQKVLGRKVEAKDLLAYIAAIVAHPGYTRRFQDDLVVPGIRIPLSADRSIWDRAIFVGRQVLLLHTFATSYPHPTLHRIGASPPEDDSPRIVSTIPYEAEEMPDTAHYDEKMQAICIGSTGRISPVPAAVWGYRVGGMRVVEKWISYRFKNPRGRPASSPLDTVNSPNWTRWFNDDLLDLLQVLGRLVRLESVQDTLLNDVCGSPNIDVLQLREAGVLPVSANASRPERRPHPTGPLAI